MTVKPGQSGLPLEKILYGPITIDRRELLITENGLYSRSERATKVTSLFFSSILSLAGIVVGVMSYVLAHHAIMILVGLGLIVLGVLGIQEFRRVEFQPVLRIEGERILVRGQDCGPSEGAYVQPKTRWTYEILLFNDQNPGGFSIIALSGGSHLSQLCALLTTHLHLDGSRTTDWPPRPAREREKESEA